MDATIVAAVLTCALAADPAATPFSAHSENFIVKAPTRDLANAVLKRAEAERRRIARSWLGSELPPSVGPAIISVKLSSEEDRGKTWAATTPERLSHMMWLSTSRERALGTTLSHEMTHVVLATQYPGRVPPWINEGAASLEDDAERLATHDRIMQWYADSGNWPPIHQVLRASTIVPQDQRAYAVAVSLTRFLLTKGDKQRALSFALAGKQGGYDAALQHFYGLQNVAALEQQWRAWVKNGGATEQAQLVRPASARLR